MRLKMAVLVGINAALIGSTAVTAADLVVAPVVEEAASTFVLTAGAGIAAYGLPDFEGVNAFTDEGSIDLGLDDIAFGGLLGFSASTSLGDMNGMATSLGMSGFVSFASRSSSSSVDLSDNDFLFIPGITTPAGTIELETDAGTSTASSEISGTPDMNQSAAVISNVGGAANGYGVDPSAGDGFSYVGIGTFAGATDTAFAFGAIADETGGVFMAVGDLDGWEVSTDVSQDLLYTGGDITFALTNVPETGDIVLTGYAGPSYRFLGQSTDTEISVNVGEVLPTTPADFAFPTYTQVTEEDLDTHYFGGIIGGTLSMPVGATASITLGLEGGFYGTSTDYEATETYSVTGGVPLSVDESVENGIEVGDSDDGFAYALRTQATWTTAIGQTTSFSLGLGGEYLSQVATIGRDPAAADTPAPAGGDVTYSGADTDTGAFITYGDMWSATLTASITGRF